MVSPREAVSWRVAAATVALFAAATAAAATPPQPPKAQMIDWDSLLPAAERAHFSTAAPAPIHDYLGEAAPGARQTGSTNVNRKLAEAEVKIPGYVVPVVVNGKGVITAFFLVPYLGSCVHVPPPPPNQLVYVRLSRGGIRLETLEEPFWVTGRLHTASEATKVATAAYTLDAERMERYEY
jgi:hypothetical protein